MIFDAFKKYLVFCFLDIPPPSGLPLWTHWSVLLKFAYQGLEGYGLIPTSACIHLPRRKETLETFLEVASRPASPENRIRDLPLETAST